MDNRLDVFTQQLCEGGHLVGVAAGSGMTAKYAVMGGCDFLLALSSGRYRNMGLSSMAGFMSFANSNDLVMDYACREILRSVGSTPVFFGYNATDPSKQMYDYIKYIKQCGFAGINNYPTVGMIDGDFCRALELDGISYRQEVEAIHFAHYCGLITLAFVFNAEQADAMTKAGADMICAHFGLTYGGYLGAKKILTLERARQTAEEIFAAVDAVNPHVIKLVYGGPIKTPLDAQYMYRSSRCQGFIGGSAFERIPIENAILDVTRSFKDNSPVVPKTKLEKIMFSDPGHYNYIDFVKEYINENYMEEITLGELAQAIHLSSSYLSSLFKKEVGCSFQRYLLSMRMERARGLIRSGSCSLLHVAQSVGYKDYVQFSKMYKKYYGFSPRSDLPNRKQTQDN